MVRHSCSESAFGSSDGDFATGAALPLKTGARLPRRLYRIAPNAAKVAAYFAKTLIAAAALKVWSLNLAATFSRVGVRNGAKVRTITKIISESPMANFHGMTDHR